MVQVTFESPYVLWLFLALPLLVLAHFYWLRATRRRAMKFANFQVLKRVTGSRLITRNYTILVLRLLALVFMILAAAETTLWYDALTNDRSFVLAIDTSASMQAQDILPTRLEAAKEYAVAFVDTIVGETEVGLVEFSGVTLIDEVPTTDRSRVRSHIDSIVPMSAGGTDIPGAIITSTNLLATSEKGRVIVLITDGSNTLETFTSDSIQSALAYALEHHVTINTIGVGSESAPIGYLPSYYNISAVYNEETLLAIANATGGAYSPALDRDGLHRAYVSIASESTPAKVRRDLAPGFMLCALVVILLEWGLLSTRFRSLP